MKENLFLIVTKEWYDKIASGEKRVEYREDTGYWNNRLFHKMKFLYFKTIEFQCGYSRKYPRLKFNFTKISIMETPESVKNTIKSRLCFAIYFK